MSTSAASRYVDSRGYMIQGTAFPLRDRANTESRRLREEDTTTTSIVDEMVAADDDDSDPPPDTTPDPDRDAAQAAIAARRRSNLEYLRKTFAVLGLDDDPADYLKTTGHLDESSAGLVEQARVIRRGWKAEGLDEWTGLAPTEEEEVLEEEELEPVGTETDSSEGETYSPDGALGGYHLVKIRRGGGGVGGTGGSDPVNQPGGVAPIPGVDDYVYALAYNYGPPETLGGQPRAFLFRFDSPEQVGQTLGEGWLNLKCNVIGEDQILTGINAGQIRGGRRPVSGRRLVAAAVTHLCPRHKDLLG